VVEPCPPQYRKQFSSNSRFCVTHILMIFDRHAKTIRIRTTTADHKPINDDRKTFKILSALTVAGKTEF